MTGDEQSEEAADSGSSVRRPITPLLLAIVLALEGFVIFFAALTAFGLKSVDPLTALIGGGVLMMLFFITAGLVRRSSWAVWVGWILQLLLLATGLILMPMFAVGGIFVLVWLWSYFRGRTIDSAAVSIPAVSDSQGDTR